MSAPPSLRSGFFVSYLEFFDLQQSLLQVRIPPPQKIEEACFTRPRVNLSEDKQICGFSSGHKKSLIF
jgi:hypothetical protein